MNVTDELIKIDRTARETLAEAYAKERQIRDRTTFECEEAARLSIQDTDQKLDALKRSMEREMEAELNAIIKRQQKRQEEISEIVTGGSARWEAEYYAEATAV